VHLAPSWDVCAGAVVLLAAAAKAARAVSWSGAAAGIVVGVAISAGFGWPGLAVLGTFFIVGSVATKVGYAKKAARGAAEARGGARDWRNVVGKGGVAAAIGAATTFALWPAQRPPEIAFTAALAAALADTLGTEIGTLAGGKPRSVPSFARVPTGTPGAVSISGTLAAAGGAAVVVGAAHLADLQGFDLAEVSWTVAACGLVACLGESLAVGLGLRSAGFVRNLMMTGLGAALGMVSFWQST
jgi:uncharacterized protein (TIGR00297 family)